ncbi:unnamed protein product, partial [Polarella glacialis]
VTNAGWRHGVPRSARAKGESISIMLWGHRGEGSFSPNDTIALKGGFPQICFEDPLSSPEPSSCEACGRTTPKLSGKVDLDGRWCCGVCW